MADKGASARSEKPTPKRRKEGVKNGQVARAPDLAAWTTVLLVTYLIPGVISTLHDLLTAWLRNISDVANDPSITAVLPKTLQMCIQAGTAMFPLMLTVLVGAALAGAAQGGARPHLARAKPKFSRINPAQGIKKVFSPTSLWELTKNLIKLTLVGFVSYRVLTGMVPILMQAGALPIATVTSTVATDAISLVRILALAGLAIGCADYLVSRRRVTKQMMMSRKEITEEHKQSDGDPMVKSQLRRRALAIVRNRMMLDIPEADVVLVNPTHVAVALKYTPGRGAPRVLAKGSGTVAARIRQVAMEARVPLVEDIPLARAIYKACDVGEEIPTEMFTAVARILAFVMGLRARGAQAGFHGASQIALARA
jgi:flagellar biosynthetic protein FlhB